MSLLLYRKYHLEVSLPLALTEKSSSKKIAEIMVTIISLSTRRYGVHQTLGEGKIIIQL